jgi:alkyl sulfatase BDS1-like metallo-beta-lactamase superfamily hydrolase
MLEIAEMLVLPKSLAEAWYNRGYYGSVNHDAKAVYQKYLGFFDGNPASLHKLPPVEASIRYVEFMGGADAILKKAKKYFDKGEYRWVAQVVNHIVFTDAKNQAARELQADALEQLGYQAESSLWRNCYLAGAQELREGVQDLPTPKTASPDVIKATTTEQFFDYLAIRLNGPEADGQNITINVDFTDTKTQYVLKLENAVLNHKKGGLDPKADVTLTLMRSTLDSVILQEATINELVKSKRVKIEGNPKKLAEFINLLDTFEFWFNIVTP